MGRKPSLGQFRFGFLVHDVSRLRRTVMDKALKPIGLTRSQWWVLSHLSRHRSHEMMQTELATLLDVGKVALGGLLDRLEAAELIVRKADSTDRRAKRIAMTRKGEEIVVKMEKIGASFNREMSKGISSEEIAMAEAVLDHMKKNLIEMDGRSKSLRSATNKASLDCD